LLVDARFAGSRPERLACRRTAISTSRLIACAAISYARSPTNRSLFIGVPLSYTPEQLCDLESIRDAALRYCRGVDRLDVDLMKSAYWPEAIDDHGVFVGNAWVFSETCMESHVAWRSTNHCILNHSIELEPDGRRARGEIYNVTYLFQKDADVLDTWHGRYLDIYEKRTIDQRREEWRILERVCVHEGTHSAPIQPMTIDTSKFRDGSFDRATPGRRIGP
jgi:hypothetical protein